MRGVLTKGGKALLLVSAYGETERERETMMTNNENEAEWEESWKEGRKVKRDAAAVLYRCGFEIRNGREVLELELRREEVVRSRPTRTMPSSSPEQTPVLILSDRCRL